MCWNAGCSRCAHGQQSLQKEAKLIHRSPCLLLRSLLSRLQDRWRLVVCRIIWRQTRLRLKGKCHIAGVWKACCCCQSSCEARAEQHEAKLAWQSAGRLGCDLICATVLLAVVEIVCRRQVMHCLQQTLPTSRSIRHCRRIKGHLCAGL